MFLAYFVFVIVLKSMTSWETDAYATNFPLHKDDTILHS